MKWPNSSQASDRQPAPSEAAATCALCGYRPGADGPPEPMRRIGAEPLVVLVCADLGRCVARYAQRGAAAQDNGARS